MCGIVGYAGRRPCEPMLTVVPLQLPACRIASIKAVNVDRPRNLAKAVTVE